MDDDSESDSVHDSMPDLVSQTDESPDEESVSSNSSTVAVVADREMAVPWPRWLIASFGVKGKGKGKGEKGKGKNKGKGGE